MAAKSTNRRPVPEAPATRQGQFVLILDGEIDASLAPWHLDDETKEIGRRGLAQAREALRPAPRPDFDEAA